MTNELFRAEHSLSRHSLQLGERDVSLLCDLLTHGAMLAEHIHALYFPGRTRRRMNQRLRQVQDARLVVRRPLPLGLGGALPNAAASYGIPWVYGLGGAATPLVAARLGWDVAEVRRLTRLGTPTAVAHTLEVVGLRLRAEHAVQSRNEAASSGTGATRLRFLPERLVRHGYQVRAPGGAWREESYRPDALIEIAFEGGPGRHFFAEVDLGHTSAAEWGTKASIATRYRRSGLFQNRYGAEGFQTLVCTTGERRRANLCRLLARRLAPEDAGRFGVATLAEIADQGLLAPVWHVPGEAAPRRLEDWPA